MIAANHAVNRQYTEECCCSERTKPVSCSRQFRANSQESLLLDEKPCVIESLLILHKNPDERNRVDFPYDASEIRMHSLRCCKNHIVMILGGCQNHAIWMSEVLFVRIPCSG